MRFGIVALVAAISFSLGAGPKLAAQPNPETQPPETRNPANVAIGSDDIGGVVTSRFGPEAGVWVIAETNDLGTRFAKIVVTDGGPSEHFTFHEHEGRGYWADGHWREW